MEQVVNFLKEAETYYLATVEGGQPRVRPFGTAHIFDGRGGDKLIGRSLLDCHNPESRDKIQQVVDWFAIDERHNIVYTFHNEKQNKDVYMVALRDEGKLIGYYEKHEYRNAETMKQYDLR